MFIVFGVVFDGSVCSGNSATSCRANGVFGENFRQRVCKLAAQCTNVGFACIVFLRYLTVK
jgi:hypothetical protein